MQKTDDDDDYYFYLKNFIYEQIIKNKNSIN